MTEHECRQGLLIDWGGVMTSNLLASFAAFCEAEGLDPQALASAFRQDAAARELLIGFEEGRIAEGHFESELSRRLGLSTADGLIDRLFSGAQPEESMVQAVLTARRQGVRTGLISNSWGTTRYPRDLLDELFEGIVISGEVGIRKPAPRIYEMGAESIGLPPQQCVFVDDLPFNLPPAEELGMAVVHHTDPAATIEALQMLLGVPLLAQQS
ncbi:MAG TPA: HAD family phosphatase [Solirubrobacteraceae bacterium]|jgi:epoxide hydrolase-like predicted phosphatase|nr:HAD family phosphatase [Solirubrobacteraceae bacterium]